jgi:hypothetical protein
MVRRLLVLQVRHRLLLSRSKPCAPEFKGSMRINSELSLHPAFNVRRIKCDRLLLERHSFKSLATFPPLYKRKIQRVLRRRVCDVPSCLTPLVRVFLSFSRWTALVKSSKPAANVLDACRRGFEFLASPSGMTLLRDFTKIQSWDTRIFAQFLNCLAPSYANLIRTMPPMNGALFLSMTSVQLRELPIWSMLLESVWAFFTGRTVTLNAPNREILVRVFQRMQEELARPAIAPPAPPATSYPSDLFLDAEATEDFICSICSCEVPFDPPNLRCGQRRHNNTRERETSA